MSTGVAFQEFLRDSLRQCSKSSFSKASRYRKDNGRSFVRFDLIGFSSVDSKEEENIQLFRFRFEDEAGCL